MAVNAHQLLYGDKVNTWPVRYRAPVARIVVPIAVRPCASVLKRQWQLDCVPWVRADAKSAFTIDSALNCVNSW